jgi:hypothetical protein
MSVRSGPPSSRSKGTRAREESTPPTKPSIAPPNASAERDAEPWAALDSPLARFHRPAPGLSYRLVLVIAGAAIGFGGLLASSHAHEGAAWLSSVPWVAAAVTLIFSLSMAVVITLSFARRLDALSIAARKLAFSRSEPSSEPASGDAVASLARCLTRMAERLHELRADQERASEQEQGRLDRLVRERTRDLGEENEDLRRVLGDSRGVFSVDLQGKLVGQLSNVGPQWLGPVPQLGHFWDYFEQAAPGAGPRFEAIWRELLQQPRDFDLRRLPRTLAVSERYLSVEYRAVRDGNGQLRRVLIVLSDITIPEPDPATPP